MLIFERQQAILNHLQKNRFSTVKELAKIVFAEDDGFVKRERLNKIAHFFVLDEVRNIIKSLSDSGYDAVLVDAPLLFESGFDKECDIILCVISEKNARIKRIMARDNITRDAAVKRIDAQLSDEFLIQRYYCDT